MCAVSVIHDYGRSVHPDAWTPEALDTFKKMVEDAKKFDKLTNQPDCEDPEKMKWVEPVEESLK